MSKTATRLISLIMLLQRKPNQKAADLAAELGVSVRTLHRYFAMLDEMGIPIYSERGPYGGFSLIKGYRMPPLVLTPEEAVAVYLGTSLVDEMWGRLYRDAAHGALAKLDNVLPDEQRQEIAWAKRTLFATGMHRTDLDALAPVLDKLRRAIHEHRRVHICYQSRSQPETTLRELDPYALVHRWGWWYVIGFCHLREAVRTFRLDRIHELSLLEAIFPVPSGFNLQDYLANEPQAQPRVIARMRFIPEARQVAYEGRFFWETLAEQDNGSVVVSFAAPDLEWAASSALAYGPLVEVLDPPELRRMLKKWAQVVAQRHND